MSWIRRPLSASLHCFLPLVTLLIRARVAGLYPYLHITTVPVMRHRGHVRVQLHVGSKDKIPPKSVPTQVYLPRCSSVEVWLP
ncbi:hypothetical protein B0H11DRAFT_1108589 [Mycena galericulata]|nr:hypothetical protein B0H11DRAFT_1108589 [Mycena galericulata]